MALLKWIYEIALFPPSLLSPSYQICPAVLSILTLVLPSAAHSLLLYHLLSHFLCLYKNPSRGQAHISHVVLDLDESSLSCIVVKTEWIVSIVFSTSCNFHLHIIEVNDRYILHKSQYI